MVAVDWNTGLSVLTCQSNGERPSPVNELLKKISQALEFIQHGWTSEAKAHAIAAMVIALRPRVSVELGVWYGKGLVTLGLAHQFIGYGMAYGIDPYSAEESVKGQVNKADHDWWATANHEAAYMACSTHINTFGVQNTVKLIRQSSDDFPITERIGLCRIDSNHGAQVLKDVRKYAPMVEYGGLLILDDIQWAGGHGLEALEWLKSNKWRVLYDLDDGKVLQR